jgi:S-adenosylmethionine decarboxylase
MNQGQVKSNSSECILEKITNVRSGSASDDDSIVDIDTAVATAEEYTTEEYTTPPYVPGTFEGPEKTLEVCFRPGVGVENGLRTLPKEKLDFLCTQAKCSILSKISSNYIDAYILSESSLFVYKDRFIMKTCGTTTLLRCLNSLLQFADELGMELNWCGYSRKNLNNPTAQLWPHSNFGDEIKYLSQHEKLRTRLHGSAHILGPVTSDHWFVFVADHSEVPHSMTCPNADKESTINMMMFDMAPEVASIFFQVHNYV